MCKVATEFLCMVVRSYVHAPFRSPLLIFPHVLRDIIFHLDGWKSSNWSLISVFRSSAIVRRNWEIFFSTLPQSELSHVMSGLRGGHIVSDLFPFHRPLNPLTWKA